MAEFSPSSEQSHGSGQAAVSLWDLSAPESAKFAVLDSDHDTEVAIVGGGFTGNSTALHLAQKGVACTVLEGEKVGFGGSGRNAGLLNAGLWLPPQDVRAAMGEARGTQLVNVLSEAPAYVFSLIEKHQIQCEATQTGTIHAAHSAAGFKDLERRASEWQRLGAPVDLLDPEQTARKVGTRVFHGGLLDHRAGTINPMGYVRGLARAAAQAGATIFESTRVTKLEAQADGWLLRTAAGVVRAKKVVLCTNAYTDELWPGLAQTFTPIHYFQVATEPLGERAAHILSEGQGVWDTGSIMFSVRKDRSGRLLFGSMGKLFGGDAASVSRRWARKTLKRLFPELGEIAWGEAWHGRIAMTQDHLPRIHNLAPGLYTPIAFNGRGIAPGTMFGKAMADLLSGSPAEELPMPISTMTPDARAGLRSAFYETAFKTYRIYKLI